MLDDWELRHAGITEIEGYEYEIVFTGSEHTFDQFIECLELRFRDYMKNKVIGKYIIATVKD
jgi:predicted RNA-binding protein with PIN domain